MDAPPFPKSFYEKAKELDITSVGFYSNDENYIEVSFDYDNYSKEKHSGKDYVERRNKLQSDLYNWAWCHIGPGENSDGLPCSGYQIDYYLVDNTVEIQELEWQIEEVWHDSEEYAMEIKDYDE